MAQKVKAIAAQQANGKLEPFQYEAGEIRPEQVEIRVTHCGVCHSDLLMWQNGWQMTAFPFVPGHEVVGDIVAVGDEVKNLKVGDKVGLGWYSGSDKTCSQCLSGNHNLCINAEQTIVGRPGGFAETVRCNWEWAVPIPENLDVAKVGPMFCGGITVFNPIMEFDIKPTHKVGVIGIGGLGHLALQFLNKWGCEVTAFTSSDSKADEAKQMGAHYVVNSKSDGELEKLAGKFDFIVNTANANLNWESFVNALAPKGRLHSVGTIPDPVALQVFPLILGQKSFSGSPLGSPATTAKMLEFSARHNIAPVTEHFPMSKANEAFEHLEAGKARYRIVLENDFHKEI